jgi:small-conductance mechanosensitive channel
VITVQGVDTNAPNTESVDDSDREQWRDRARNIRNTIRGARAAVDTSQAALDKLRSPYRWPPTMTDNPEVTKAESELTSAKAALAAAEKALSDLEEEARRRRVPAGWIADR